MTSARSALRLAVPAVVAVTVVEAVISIAVRWPHQFGGHGRPGDVLSEFATSGGTALAPPLILIVVLALIAVGVQRVDRWRTVATVLLLPVAAIMTVGAAGEAAASATPNVPNAALVVGGVVGALLSIVLFGLAIASLVEGRVAAVTEASLREP